MPSFTRNINVISRCAHAYRADCLADSGLGEAHYFYILRICSEPGISQDALAKSLYINKSSVTRALTTLEENGFVTRTPSPDDRRVVCVYPTERAHGVLPLVRRISRAWNQFLLSELDEEEKAAFLATLEKVTGRARQYIDDHLDGKELTK